MEGTAEERMCKVQSGSVSVNQLLPDAHLWCTPVVVNILTLQMAALLRHVSELEGRHLKHRCPSCWLL